MASASGCVFAVARWSGERIERLQPRESLRESERQEREEPPLGAPEQERRRRSCAGSADVAEYVLRVDFWKAAFREVFYCFCVVEKVVIRVCLRLSISLISAFVLSAGSFLFDASDAFGADPFDLSKWTDSSSREAGARQTLTIGGAEYGFRWIPAGEFEMGSPKSEEGRYADERLHHVKLTKGFWTSETETTQALYREIMGTNPSENKSDELPVECVSWDDAVKFCEELTKRLPSGMTATLPTEAQWEYACRAGTKTAFCYGESVDSDKVNYHSSGAKAVKSRPPNPWGLYDMHGNVWEWTLDCYAADYPSGTATNPTGPKSASYRAARGGCWKCGLARDCRSAQRGRYYPFFRFDFLGFRFVITCD